VRRILVLLALGSVAALLPAASGLAGASQRQTVKVRNTALGKILVNGQGFTLYVFTRDRKNKDRCVKVSGCLQIWPALPGNRKPIAGRGVKASLLGTITISRRVKQVTYAGHPLYTYVGDSGIGETSYVGTPQFGGTWYAINAAGHLVK
jgi:predicted lipoprotein with Yx(FWY)xxD motif